MLLHSEIKPIPSEVKHLAEAVINLLKADADLAEAKSKVPRYTGHLSSGDYYAQEQQEWNLAAESLYYILEENIQERIQASGGRRGR